jgi:hypothetical protein
LLSNLRRREAAERCLVAAGEDSMSKLFALCAAGAVAVVVGLSSTPSSAQSAGQCGGFFGIPCHEGFVCRYPPHCSDCFGVCVPAHAARRHSVRKDRPHKDQK